MLNFKNIVLWYIVDGQSGMYQFNFVSTITRALKIEILMSFREFVHYLIFSAQHAFFRSKQGTFLSL